MEEGRDIKGIMFRPDMIKAISDGIKSVTRRLHSLKPINKEPDEWFFIENKERDLFLFGQEKGNISNNGPCTIYQRYS